MEVVAPLCLFEHLNPRPHASNESLFSEDCGRKRKKEGRKEVRKEWQEGKKEGIQKREGKEEGVEGRNGRKE
jgi:hypothetical protein